MTAWVSDPDATLRWAARVLTSRRVPAATRARAWHAAALAHMEKCEPALARRAARRALSSGPEAHLVLAWIELDAGNSRASLRHLDLAQPALHGALLARARCLRGLSLCVAGDHERAQGELSAAIRGSRRHGDRHWLANARNARGVARTYLRRFAAANRDLAAAADLYAALSEPERAATCVHNRGCVALQAGDVPQALRLFDEAVRAGLRVNARGEALIDRAQALLSAGLATEASEILTTATDLLDSSGRTMRLAEAWFALARCAPRPDLALAAAHRATTLFRAQRRTPWTTAAESVALRLTVTHGTTVSGVRGARAVADRCVRFGFPVEAAELRLAVGSRDLLRLVEGDRFSGRSRLAALGWLARARLAALDNDRRALFAACRAGLRTGIADVTGELTGLAVAAALDDPAGVLRWVGGVPVGALVERLGGRAMVCYLHHAGALSAVSVVDGLVRLHRLGGMPVEVEALRLAVTGGSGEPLARRVDEALLAPLRELLGDRHLVVVPAAGLCGLPWAALPTCAGRPVSVAPSVGAWMSASRVSSAADTMLWVAGPGLRHADREVAALHRRYGGTLLTGSESTVDRVRAGADLVHIAAHGRYRAEAPLYSYLELADGPLYGHELGTPRILVLSACECALAVPLSPGTRAMIASTVPVADDHAVDLVLTLHGQLRSGRSPAEALAAAQTEHGDRGFACVGAG